MSASHTQQDNLLQQLGIFGWQQIEPLLLAGILLGEPTLLVGEPGSAKTYLGSVLQRALSEGRSEMKYGYYDIGRAGFEDILGFPNAEAFKAGRSEFIHNQTTIWDKQIILIDEVSRAAPDTANKWLEILGRRSLMGQALQLQVVLAAMNPPTHQGTRLLSSAFADRFSLFIELPSFHEMEEEARDAILSSRTAFDAPSVQLWQEEGIAAASGPPSADFTEGALQLQACLSKAAINYLELESGSAGFLCQQYAELFGLAMLEAGIKLEARRLKMIKRALLATIAVRQAQLGQEQLSQAVMIDCAAMISGSCLPQKWSQAQGIETETLLSAHAQACAALNGQADEIKLFAAASQAERLALLLKGDFTDTVQEKVCADFLADQSREADMAAWVLGQLLIQSEASNIPAHCLDRLAERFQQCEQRLAQTAQIQLDLSASCPKQLEAYIEAQQLIEQADANTESRVACAWALSQSAGDPRKILLEYPLALSELRAAMGIFREIAAQWGVDGAQNYQAA